MSENPFLPPPFIAGLASPAASLISGRGFAGGRRLNA